MARLPRFRRSPGLGRLQLTVRDNNILLEVARYRFLDSKQIISLVGGSEQHVLKRLQALFHAGYLDRPKAQIRYYSEEGSLPLVYGLGRKGARVLARTGKRTRGPDNRTAKQLYLQHTLLVAEVMIAFVRACRKPGAPKLLLEEDLAPNEDPDIAFRWAVTVRDGDESRRVAVVPDQVFAVENTTGERILFVLEADRATMPLTRRSMTQTSIWRKLLGYKASWSDSVHKERFGCDRIRVLLVTEGLERAQHVAQLASEIKRGRGLFLVTDVDSLREKVFRNSPGDLFSLSWLTSTGGKARLAEMIF
jgi:hypothetical protein